MALSATALVPAGLASPQPPPILVTANTFADNSPATTIEIVGCDDQSGELSFKAPSNAVFGRGAVRIRFAPNATATQALVQIDVGLDGNLDVNTTLVAPSSPTVELGALGFNAYLSYWGDSRYERVPARVTACAASGTVILVIDQVDITYWTGGNPHRPPTVVREPPPLEVLAGAQVARALDLAPYFADPEGEPLTYQVWRGYPAQEDSSGVRAAVEGSVVRIISENSSFWGEAGASFLAADPHGLVARAQGTSIHVRPRAPLVATNTALAADDGTAGGGPSYWRQFQIPADATIQNASFQMSSDIPASAMEDLATTIRVECGGQSLAAVVPAMLPLEVHLNSTVLNQQLWSHAWYGVSFVEVRLAVDSHGGIAVVAIENLTITYTRYPAGPLPVVAGILINGTNSTVVEAGAPLPYDVLVGGSRIASFEIEWFVDGVLTREGQTVYEVVMPPGEHLVEVRISNETESTSYRLQVRAEGQVPGSPRGVAETLLWVGIAGAGVAILAIGLSRKEARRQLMDRRKGPR